LGLRNVGVEFDGAQNTKVGFFFGGHGLGLEG
jgi:hypothetical protein